LGLLLETTSGRCDDAGYVLTEGRRIALRRDDLALNQDELAERARVSRSSVWKLENDQRVRDETRAAILNALAAEERKKGLDPLRHSAGAHSEPSKEGADAGTGTSRQRYERLRALEAISRSILDQLRDILDEEAREHDARALRRNGER
jgi:transcriptional regulator with XRE-family HTH domain